MIESISQQLGISPFLLIILIIWTILWKALALWKSARLNQLIWFVLLLLINTLGLLEILYLFLFSKHAIKPTPRLPSKKRKK